MNIIVVTNDGINISSPYSKKYNYKLFELDRKRFDINSIKISELVSTTEQIGRLINDVEFNEILNSNTKKTIFVSNNLSPHLLKLLRRSGVETYITFKKSINKALHQYYSDLFINHHLTNKDYKMN